MTEDLLGALTRLRDQWRKDADGVQAELLTIRKDHPEGPRYGIAAVRQCADALDAVIAQQKEQFHETRILVAEFDVQRPHIEVPTFETRRPDGCAWLIETAQDAYWNGHYIDERGFTSKVDDAVRFARFQDAECVKHWLIREHAWALRTAQHCWVTGSTDSAPKEP